MMKLTKETVLANLYLMKIHLLILKLFIVKGVFILGDENTPLKINTMTLNFTFSENI